MLEIDIIWPTNDEKAVPCLWYINFPWGGLLTKGYKYVPHNEYTWPTSRRAMAFKDAMKTLHA